MPRGGASNRGPRSATWDSTNSRAAARTRLEPGIGTARRVVSDRLAPDPEAETTPYADSRFSRHKYRIAATAYDLTLDTRLPAARSCRPSARWRVRASARPARAASHSHLRKSRPKDDKATPGPRGAPPEPHQRSGGGRAVQGEPCSRPKPTTPPSARSTTSISAPMAGPRSLALESEGVRFGRRVRDAPPGEPDGRRATGTAGAPAPRDREGYQV
jgi:hypothetical protein